MARSSTPRSSRRLLAGLAVLLLACATPAAALTVRLLGTSPASTAFEQALRGELGAGHQVVTDAAEADVVLVLHEGALEEGRRIARPRLLLLPVAGLPLQAEETALYWAPPLVEQVRLAARLMPGLRRVGVLAGAQDLPRVEALRPALASHRIELLARAGDPQLLPRQVSDLAASVDILVAPVDARLYHRDNLKPVLLAAYRQNRALIGPNPAWVRAGALASLHATPETLAADVAAAIRALDSSGRWPPPAPASRFDVITNPQVGRALGVRMPDAASLTRALQSEKGGIWP